MDNSFKINKGMNLVGQTTEPTGADGDVYYNATLNKFRKHENGAWSDLALPSDNYVKNPDAEADVANTSDSGAAVTITRETTNPLRGSGSFNCTFSSSATVADYADFDLDPIELADDNGKLSVKFKYSTENSISSGDFELVLWNSTDSTAEVLGDLGATGDYLIPSRFVSVAKLIDITKTYKLRLRPTFSFGTARTVRMDEIVVNDESFIPGLLPKDIVVFTGTESVATTTDVTFDPLTAIEDNVNGLNGASRYTFQHDGEFNIIGKASFSSASTGFRAMNYKINGGSGVRPLSIPGTSGTATTQPFSDNITVSKGDYIEFYARQSTGGTETVTIDVKIEEVTQRSGMISTTENLFKNSASRVYLASNQVFTDAAENQVLFDTIDVDSNGIFSLTDNGFKAVSNGLHYVSFKAETTSYTASDPFTLRIKVNGSTKESIAVNINDTDPSATLSALVDLEIGDIVDFFIDPATETAYSLIGGIARTSAIIFNLQDTSVFSVSGEREMLEVALGTTQYTTTIDQWIDAESTPTLLDLTPGKHILGYDLSGYIRTKDATKRLILGNIAIAESTVASGTTGMPAGIIQESISMIQHTFINAVANDAESFPASKANIPVTISSNKSYKIMVRCSDATASGEFRVANQTWSGAVTDPDVFPRLYSERDK